MQKKVSGSAVHHSNASITNYRHCCQEDKPASVATSNMNLLGMQDTHKPCCLLQPLCLQQWGTSNVLTLSQPLAHRSRRRTSWPMIQPLQVASHVATSWSTLPSESTPSRVSENACVKYACCILSAAAEGHSMPAECRLCAVQLRRGHTI